MGFLDKAKELAGHGQTKLDEVQGQFDEQSAPAPSGPVIEYDARGRPVPPPATPGVPPTGSPAAPPVEAPPAAPPAPPTPGTPAVEADPNHPSQAAPTLTSGDPPAG